MSVRRESSTKSNNSTKFISIFIIVFIGVVALFYLIPKNPNTTPTTQVELYYDAETGQQYSRDLKNPDEGFVPINDIRGSSPYYPIRGNK